MLPTKQRCTLIIETKCSPSGPNIPCAVYCYCYSQVVPETSDHKLYLGKPLVMPNCMKTRFFVCFCAPYFSPISHFLDFLETFWSVTSRMAIFHQILSWYQWSEMGLPVATCRAGDQLDFLLCKFYTLNNDNFSIEMFLITGTSLPNFAVRSCDHKADFAWIFSSSAFLLLYC